METWGLKVMMMGKELTVMQPRKRYPCVGFVAKELEQTQYGANVVKGGATRDLQGSEI